MPTRHVSPEEASRILNRLADRLETAGDLPDQVARGVLRQAQRAAGMRPTPQAPMVAETLAVENGHIISLSGDSPPAEVAIFPATVKL